MKTTCIHAKLQMQLVVPEECFVRGDIVAWYKCERCGDEFRTDLKPSELHVSYGRADVPRKEKE